MKISIITICYNDKKGFERTANSIVKQTFKNYEWIVIDGGSTDGTVESIQKYEGRIKYWVSESDTGIYNAMNKGTFHAEGEYCLYLNSGDRFCSTKSLERASSRAWKADVLSFDMFFDTGNRFIPCKSSPNEINYTRFVQSSLFHQATFVRTSVAKQIPYDEKYRIVSDCKFWFQVLIVDGYTYQHFNIPLSIFDTNGISSTINEQQIVERKSFLAEYFDKRIVDKIHKDTSLLKIVESLSESKLSRSAITLCIRNIIRCDRFLLSKMYDILKNAIYRDHRL